MDFFYFDKVLQACEDRFQWDDALKYLGKKYAENRSIPVLNSLIGFSWFYLIEGPVISRKYSNDPNSSALQVWKKYLDLGAKVAFDNPFVCYISGYTLSLHGFYLSEEYEKKGIIYMKKCLSLSENTMLYELAYNFIENEAANHYIPLKNGCTICKELFRNKSLLERYFHEIFTS